MSRSTEHRIAKYVIKSPIGPDYMGLAFIEWERGNVQTITTCNETGRLVTTQDYDTCEMWISKAVIQAFEDHYGLTDEMEFRS